MTEIYQIREWIASDGYRIRYRYYPAQGSPKGIIVSLHGIQSHSGWYDYSSRFLAEEGYEVHFLDRRGSGLNSSQRGHAKDAQRLTQDVTQFLFDLKHQNESGIPIYLLGLSWGGKLAAVVAGTAHHLINGLILLYPGICAQIRPNWIQKRLLKVFKGDRFQYRKRKIPLDDSTLFTNEKDWQEWIENDYHSLREASFSFFWASLQLDRQVKLVPEKLHIPVLVMLAEKDRIIDNQAMREYFQQIASTEKKLIEYPGAAHTLEFEKERDSIFRDLVSWLQSLENSETTIKETGELDNND